MALVLLGVDQINDLLKVGRVLLRIDEDQSISDLEKYHQLLAVELLSFHHSLALVGPIPAHFFVGLVIAAHVIGRVQIVVSRGEDTLLVLLSCGRSEELLRKQVETTP